MTTIEVCRTVTENGCHLVRQKKIGAGYDAKPFIYGSKRGWFYVDSFSASAVLAVYNALNETNRAKLASLPIQKAAIVAFKLLKNQGAA